MKTKNSNTQEAIERKIRNLILSILPDKELVGGRLNERSREVVANEIVFLFSQELQAAEERGREEVIKEIEDTLTKAFVNMNFDGGVDKGENEHWHFFFEDTVWKNFEKVFKKLQAIKEK